VGSSSLSDSRVQLKLFLFFSTLFRIAIQKLFMNEKKKKLLRVVGVLNGRLSELLSSLCDGKK
jgi:hypothetical protein